MKDMVGAGAQMAHVMNGMRVLTLASIFITANFAVVCILSSWILFRSHLKFVSRVRKST